MTYDELAGSVKLSEGFRDHIYKDTEGFATIGWGHKVVHEDNLTGGFGGELVSIISDIGFEFLDSPIKRVASKDCHVPYSPILEDEILVQTQWIKDMISKVMKF